MNKECNTDVKSYAVSFIPRQLRTITPIGLAKDGRVIYGPYKQDGTLWQPCDVDICNGRMFGSYYGYVATTFHPYFVGCWGPGTDNILSAGCSANSGKCVFCDENPEDPECSYASFMSLSIFALLISAFVAFF